MSRSLGAVLWNGAPWAVLTWSAVLILILRACSMPEEAAELTQGHRMACHWSLSPSVPKILRNSLLYLTPWTIYEHWIGNCWINSQHSCKYSNLHLCEYCINSVPGQSSSDHTSTHSFTVSWNTISSAASPDPSEPLLRVPVSEPLGWGSDSILQWDFPQPLSSIPAGGDSCATVCISSRPHSWPFDCLGGW